MILNVLLGRRLKIRRHYEAANVVPASTPTDFRLSQSEASFARCSLDESDISPLRIYRRLVIASFIFLYAF